MGIFREDFLRWMVYNVRVRNRNRNRSADAPRRRVAADNFGGQWPQPISHGNLQQIVTAPPKPGNGGLPKPPLPKGGASATPRRGDSVAKATDFFPIPYSLFPKKPFHIGFLGMISANCESLSHGYAVPAPFSKGAFGAGLWLLRFRPRNIKYAQIPLTYNRFYCIFDLETPKKTPCRLADGASPLPGIGAGCGKEEFP